MKNGVVHTMEIRIFRYFLAVVREENISRAAEVLHITQPALSRHMAQLEEELGTQLFVRGKRLVLTDAGVILRRRAEEAVELIDKIEGEFSERSELGGVISIGSGALKSSGPLAEAMLDFNRLYPNVQFEIYTNNAEHIKMRLDKGLLDFGLLMEPVDIERYDYIRMKERERWGIFMRRDNRLAGKEFITKEDLAGVPLVTPQRNSVRKEIESWLGEDFSSLTTFATCNVITNGTMLINNETVCFLTIEGSIDLMEGTEFIFIPLYPELSMTSVFAWKKYQPVTRAAGKFLEHFKSML